jgi:hypothetical protein
MSKIWHGMSLPQSFVPHQISLKFEEVSLWSQWICHGMTCNSLEHVAGFLDHYKK